MPVTKQAIKKVRQDKRKVVVNMRVKKAYKAAVQVFRKHPTAASLSLAFKALDRAAKTNVIHKNKAGRLKSRLTKLIETRSTKGTVSKPSVKTSSKVKAKKS